MALLALRLARDEPFFRFNLLEVGLDSRRIRLGLCLSPAAGMKRYTSRAGHQQQRQSAYHFGKA